MFVVNEDNSIYVTRGDAVFFSVSVDDDGQQYEFQPGDVVRIKVYGRKNAENVLLQKDFPVTEATESVDIYLTEAETKIGKVISKPTDYWYEVELNPFTDPQTVIGYDEDGAKVFRLFPEGDDVPEFVVEPEDIPVVDKELDMTSTRPVQNQAIARAVVALKAGLGETKEDVTEKTENLSLAVAVERARIDSIVALKEGSTTGDAELIDGRMDTSGMTHPCLGDAIRSQFNAKQDLFAEYNDVILNIVENTVYNVDSKTTQALTYGQYAEYAIRSEKVLKISGFSHSSPSPFPVAAFFDASNNIIAKIGASSALTAFEEMLVPVPSGASKLILNGKKWEGDIALKVCAPRDLNKLYDNVHSIVPEQFNGCVNMRDRIVTYALTEENTELLEAQLYNGIGELETGVIGNTTYDTIIFPISGIWRYVDLSNYPVGSHGGAFLNAERKWISSFSTAIENDVYKELKPVPVNAKYIAITKGAVKPYQSIYVHSSEYEFDGLRVHGMENQLFGKKVVWLGTSVSHGQYAEKAYPHEAAQILGFELVNCSVPGLATHTNADGSMKQYGSLVLSKAECEAQGMEIPDAPIAYAPGGNYNNYYRTYENVFSGANADADLFVFDIVPNNTDFGMTDWNAFDFANWCYKDGSAFEDHRSTFLGALLFLMDKMYALNENARMVFVLGSGFAYWQGKTAFQTVKDKWNIPCIDLWGKVNTSPKSLVKLRSKDGTDPHPSTLAHEIMGRMLANDLPGVY